MAGSGQFRIAKNTESFCPRVRNVIRRADILSHERTIWASRLDNYVGNTARPSYCKCLNSRRLAQATRGITIRVLRVWILTATELFGGAYRLGCP